MGLLSLATGITGSTLVGNFTTVGDVFTGTLAASFTRWPAPPRFGTPSSCPAFLVSALMATSMKGVGLAPESLHVGQVHLQLVLGPVLVHLSLLQHLRNAAEAGSS